MTSFKRFKHWVQMSQSIKTNMAGCSLYIKLFIVVLFFAGVFVNSHENTKMKLTGKITVKEGVSLGEESFLSVKLEDTSRMDASAIVLGKHEEMLQAGTIIGPGHEGLNYTIVCEKPRNLGSMYSISAVLNVGWKASGEEWIRKGDYFTDTVHDVDLSQGTDPIIADVVMVHYPQ